MNLWEIINLIDGISHSKDNYHCLERNAQIGVIALHFATKNDTYNNHRDFVDSCGSEIRDICRNPEIEQINLADFKFIISLSYLIHSTLHQPVPHSGNWHSSNPKPNKCQWPGCAKAPTDRDHIWPNSLGGPYEKWNQQWLCKFHNVMKSNSPIFTLQDSPDFEKNFISWMELNGYMT